MPLTEVSFNPFADDSPAAPAARSVRGRLTPVTFDPFADEAPTPTPATPSPRTAGRTVAGHARELAVGVPAGAVQAAGTSLRGAAVVEEHWHRKYAGLLDAIDELDPAAGASETAAGLAERIKSSELTSGRQQMLRATLRSKVEGSPQATDIMARARSVIPAPMRERGLWRAGEAASRFAEETFPAAPGYEDALSRMVGEGVGSLATGVAVSAIPGIGPLAGPALFTTMGAGEAADRAIAAGASDEDIVRAAGLGLGAGATDVLPVEILLGRLPVPGMRAIAEMSKRLGGKRVARALGRIGAQGAIEAAQEGGQQALQNLIAREIHSPEQAIMEGVEEGATVGEIVGNIAGASREVILGIANRRSRSRRGTRAAAVNEVPPLSQEDRASPIPDDIIQEGRERVADAGATEQVDAFLGEGNYPQVGQPVRIVRGREVFEGVVTDGWQGEDPGMSVEALDGTQSSMSTFGELELAGATIDGLPMPAEEATVEQRRGEVAQERESVRLAAERIGLGGRWEFLANDPELRAALPDLVADPDLAAVMPQLLGKPELLVSLEGMAGDPAIAAALPKLAGKPELAIAMELLAAEPALDDAPAGGCFRTPPSAPRFRRTTGADSRARGAETPRGTRGCRRSRPSSRSS